MAEKVPLMGTILEEGDYGGYVAGTGQYRVKATVLGATPRKGFFHNKSDAYRGEDNCPKQYWLGILDFLLHQRANWLKGR